MFAQHVGIDLEKELQHTDEALILGGIKLPHPMNEKDAILMEYELPDVVFSSYLKREYEGFDSYCSIVGNTFGDFNEGPYEYENICLKEGNVVFDCGANMGMFSAVASCSGCQVFAFEAIPDIIDNYLSKTARMNGNIHIVNSAVWDKEETLEFTYTYDNIGSSHAEQLRENTDSEHKVSSVVVAATTLDMFVEKNGIERVDFVKADIEGAERNMLRGATKILKNFAPKLSICTYHHPDDSQVLREVILEANSKYQIVEKFKKMYAWIP